MTPQRRPAAGGDPLGALAVWDSLTVGPVRVEKRRLIAPYTVVRGGETHATELVYRWEEDVLEPGDPASENLAVMIAAQVALNYGLFCQELRIHGPLDPHDRRFLADMARNTAREIYVLKFLRENVFLRGDAATVPVVRQADYLRARLVFDGEPAAATATARWPQDAARHAVLSSGGKDSLLTYGLLRELDREVHPVFVNESGRHWFTALNAYRHLAETDPRCARVWTNCDRVFAWALRQLPFVREDFAELRTDYYPIRLWTVAVFLFGALPVLRRRGIGRLLIGDEHDTTERGSFQGITHYHGLFDQSRWFDQVLSRYFRRKGWQVAQFSILRPLSELLIEDVLASRYPDLLAHQVSCHAAHKEDERIRPCGRCEKCRRIVGMLTALGHDPRVCGYTDAQVASCLDAVRKLEVHQERAGTEQMLWLLDRAAAAPPAADAGPHPEVQQLRFDRERSPVDAIPQDLRAALWRLLLQHARGAVRRRGRAWEAWDVLHAPELAAPYPFEVARAGTHGRDEEDAAPGAAPPPPERAHRLGLLTWPQAEQRLREVDTALLPVGAIEQHGPHLPLDVDAYDAEALALAVAERCTQPRPLVLPLIPYGVSYHHEAFAGTLSVGPDTLARMVYEIGMAAAKHGIRKLVIVNGHGGNGPALHFAAQQINRDAHIFTCVDTGETSDVDVDQLTETPNDVHAGEVETSTTLAQRPEVVDMSRAEPHVPEFSSGYLDFTSRRGVGWYAHTHRISPTGVLGDPTRASVEKGRQMWEIIVRNLAELVEDLKGLSLEEIHQRRY